MAVLRGRGRSSSRSATSFASMSCNSRNVKLPFLTTRCQYQGLDLLRGVDLPPGLPKLLVSASVKWQIFYHLVSRNVKLPFRCTGRLAGGRSATFGVVVLKESMLNWLGENLPLDLPI